MQVASGHRYSDVQIANIPKLTYRKPAQAGEPQSPIRPNVTTTNFEAQDVPSPRRSGASAGASTQDAYGSVAQDANHSQSGRPSVVPGSGTMQKKKAWHKGLFTKEPTMVALAQVEAEMKAKHGSVKADAVPHVSSSKMPGHVPKVNSKWDGMPEAIKVRERESRERERVLQRSSLLPPSTGRSRSSDPTAQFADVDFRGRRQRQYSTDDSHNESWDYEKGEYRGSGTYENSVRSRSLCSDDSDRYGPPRHRPASQWSQSLKSPSGNSLPEITSFFPNNAPRQAKKPKPKRGQSSSSSYTNSTDSSGRPRYETDQYVDYRAPAVDAIPEHSSSPVATPRESSPVTPGYLSDSEKRKNSGQAIETVLVSGQNIASPRNSIIAKGKGKPGAFLAGEARPMELPGDESRPPTKSDLPLRQDSKIGRLQQDIGKRPRSSRDRLGLGASMVVRTEAAPWETQKLPTSPKSPTTSRPDPTSPKKRLSKSFVGLGK